MKKSARKSNAATREHLVNLGLVPGDDLDDDENDEDLEAELNKLMYGNSKAVKPRKRKVPEPNLEAMVAQCMVDIPSDAEDDDEDPDLLDELAQFEDDDEEEAAVPVKPPPKLVKEEACQSNQCAGQSILATIEARIELYVTAEKRAKEAGDSAKSRRFSRGLATLMDQKKKVQAGKAINEDDIPPLISNSQVTSPQKEEDQPLPRRPSPALPAHKSNNPIVKELQEKRNYYKTFALSAKKSGDKQNALKGLQFVKQCDDLILKASRGEAVDLASLPPLLVQRAFSRDDPINIPDNVEDLPPPDPKVFGAPPPPSSVEGALHQRLAKYAEDEAKAKEEGNQSRVRRLGRIVKQYEEAIKLHKKGKLATVLADLPCPPGFGPIPVPGGEGGSTASAPPTAEVAAEVKQPDPQQPAAAKKHLSLQDKQLLELQKRQNQFKSAALTAKKSGQMEQAKEYLRQAKGFDNLIDAAKSGLPVDFKTLPVAPQAVKDVAMDFEIVSTEECSSATMSDSSSRTEMYVKLEQDLLSQIKMCQANRVYFKSTGDVPSMNKFQQMEEHTKKDLDSLRFAFKRGDPVPKFHYEVRAFSKVVVCSDLTDNELEFTVVQAINLNVAKDAHTYCRLEFPYPKEAPFKDKTVVVKDTNCPEYNHAVKVPLNIKDKSCQRVFKRHAAKVEVWNKIGFLRSDVCVGSVQVKLQPLETQCVLHESFALMDGRKAVGGQVEVKVRMRNPLVSKQIEKVEEKWLVISFL